MRKTTVLALIVSLASASVLLADKPMKKEKGKGGQGNDAKVTVVFADSDREAARLYFSEKYGRGNCPPGLAKKNNGCLPPGQAKKRYQVGQRLSRAIVFVEPPAELAVRLRPSTGYRYVIVDGDLVKLAIGTMLVVDEIGRAHV